MADRKRAYGYGSGALRTYGYKLATKLDRIFGASAENGKRNKTKNWLRPIK